MEDQQACEDVQATSTLNEQALTSGGSSISSWQPARLGTLRSILFKAQLAYGDRRYGIRGGILRRISRTLAVKAAPCTSLTEALALEYIASNTTIPVPRVHRVFKDGRGWTNIIMDYVDGVNLGTVWSGLQPTDRLAIVHQLRDYILQLRKLEPPHPGVVEAVGGYGCRDLRIDSASFGPFQSVVDFREYLGHNWLIKNRLDQFEEFAPALLRCTPRSYRTVFTHGDLAPRNILVKGTRIVAIVDWETSGWYPEYWEYTQAFFSNDGYPVIHPAGFWYLFEKEALLEKYPDELEAERCRDAYFVR